MKNIGISLVMIVKNEAARITSFLTHHKALVQEMIVLDTGSTDKTKMLADAAGASVQSFEWCDDFSAARNAALQLANHNWVLCIDADEIIATSDFETLQLATLSDDCCYIMPQRNYYNDPQHPEWIPVKGEYPKEEKGNIGYFVAQNTKFFARRTGLRFEGCVHENVLASAKRNKVSVAELPVPIHHYGYVISEDHNKSRNAQYGILLEKKLSDQPNDPQTMEEYASHLLQVRKSDKAIPFLEKLNESPKTNNSITRARILLGTLRMAKGDVDHADTIFHHAVEKDPASLFAHVELLKFLLGQRRYDEMTDALATALDRFGEQPQLLREESRYLIETRQIHRAAVVTRKVAVLFPTMPEYAQLATRCETISKKMKEMEST